MAEVVDQAQHDFWRPPMPVAEVLASRGRSEERSATCHRCGTEFIVSSLYCHACGASRPGLNARTLEIPGFAELASLGERLGLTTPAVIAFLAGVLHGKDQYHDTLRGLELADADTLTNVILYELLDNVWKHAESTTWALVAAWARPSTAPPKASEHVEAERGYLSWLAQRQTPTLEIVLGDSGKGIVETLAEHYERAITSGGAPLNEERSRAASVLLWAFDRWSSSKNERGERGTRGLYRVDRIVKKYQGLVTLRCENKLVGWDHGGMSYDKEEVEEKRLPSIPGTIIHLWLPPHLEQPIARAKDLGGDVIPSIEILRLDNLSNIGLDQVRLKQLQSLLQKTDTGCSSCVFAVIEGGEAEKSALELVLSKTAEMRHRFH